MRLLLLLTLAALAGCTSAPEKAEQEYAIVEKSGDAATVCRKGDEVAEAYLKANDAEHYATRRLETNLECTSRKTEETNGIFRYLDGSTGHVEPDNINAD
jgi:hypothetical protein